MRMPLIIDPVPHSAVVLVYDYIYLSDRYHVTKSTKALADLRNVLENLSYYHFVVVIFMF